MAYYWGGQTAGPGWIPYTSLTEIALKSNVRAGGTSDTMDSAGLQTSVFVSHLSREMGFEFTMNIPGPCPQRFSFHRSGWGLGDLHINTLLRHF